MGVGTGRRNKRNSDPRATQQMALQQPPPVVTTWVKVTTAAQILNELASPRQQALRPQMTFPSNLANRRSVGQRAGPSYSGPTSLDSIYRN